LAFGARAVYYDVKIDGSKLSEMLQISNGVRKVPVIVEDGKMTVGYEGGT